MALSVRLKKLGPDLFHRPTHGLQKQGFVMIPTPEPLDAQQMQAVIRLFELRESELALAARELDALAGQDLLNAQQVKAVRALLSQDDATVDRALFKACADGEAIELLLDHRTYVAYGCQLAGVD